MVERAAERWVWGGEHSLRRTRVVASSERSRAIVSNFSKRKAAIGLQWLLWLLWGAIVLSVAEFADRTAAGEIPRPRETFSTGSDYEMLKVNEINKRTTAAFAFESERTVWLVSITKFCRSSFRTKYTFFFIYLPHTRSHQIHKFKWDAKWKQRCF